MLKINLEQANNLKGKQCKYISNLGFSIIFTFEFISTDNGQVNGIYNPANCYCMEV